MGAAAAVAGVPGTEPLEQALAVLDEEELLIADLAERAGKIDSSKIAFILDTTPPETSIEIPESNALYGGPLKPVVEISGHVVEANPDYWEQDTREATLIQFCPFRSILI